MDNIIVKGARENNLKNINITIPKNKLVVMTGVSGSGKSSLAFDTIYAEGQRRYVESLSAYARQFLGGTEKPRVDSIEGLSPAISIEQKTTSKNPRSTVATVTEIYDYMRLLFARIGVPHCPAHNRSIKSQSVEEMVNRVLTHEEGSKIIIMAPMARGEKGTYADLFEKLRKSGYARVRVNGETYDLSEAIKLDKNKKHTIEVIIDRLKLNINNRSRIHEGIEIATTLASGKALIGIGSEEILMSEVFACTECDFSLTELEPKMFSFNSPYGACTECKGLGFKSEIDEDLIVPDRTKSINDGAIASLSGDFEKNYAYQKMQTVADFYGIDLDKPFNKLSNVEQGIMLYGSDDAIDFEISTKSGNTYRNHKPFEGIITNLERRFMETTSNYVREWINGFMTDNECPDCGGKRLNEGVLAVRISKKNIYELTKLSVGDLLSWFGTAKLTEQEKEISDLIIKEITSRLSFLVNVGLDYLTLNRSAGTLSGGESQRIRLATQIGSRLTGVLYVLDEPSIGLHQRDNQKLINSLKEMRDIGNTLVVVEHDEDTMLQADYLIDIGPGAGDHGGKIIAKGTPEEVMVNSKSLTGKYLSNKERIEVPKQRRTGNGDYLEVIGAKANNLKNINVKFPLGTLTVVTGVSGSGKSTLINDILHKKLASLLYKTKERPLAHKDIKGTDHINKVVDISQSPIGRTPRSNPATYVGVFDDIRDVFANAKEARARGYLKGRFSFNVKGGRCEACSGDGVKKIEMHFLPDVYITCEVCNGTRYNSETLDIKFKDKNIADVLAMRVDEALTFFENIPKVKNKLLMMQEVGLGYIKLGQSATTLSGGEAARVKLAKELQKRPTGKSLFILDEPTTGLHAHDIKKLLAVLQRIVDHGDTVIVIEHNLDVIKIADYIIDLGPEGGDKGGTIVTTGTPEEVIKCKESYTGQFLKKHIKR